MTSHALARGIAAGVLAACCVECTIIVGPGWTEDAGVDAGDGGGDGGEQRTDAVAPDATTLADPGWRPLEAIPAECEMALADHPERTAIEFRWDHCGDGCRVWGGRPRTEMSFRRVSSAAGVAGLAVATWGDAEGRVVFAVVSLDDGRPLLAVRGPPGPAGLGYPWCAVSAVDVTQDALAISVSLLDYDDTGMTLERGWIRFVRIPISDPHAATVEGQVDDTRLGVQALHLAEGRMAAQVEAGLVWGIASGTVDLLSRPFGIQTVQRTQVVRGGVVWENWAGSGVRLAAWSPGIEALVVRDVAGGDVRGLAADGSVLAWLEGTGYDLGTLRYANVELWTAEYEPGALREARMVRTLHVHGGGALGAGLYVRAEPAPGTGETVYGLYRLADGARASFTPAEPAAEGVLAVTEREVVLRTTRTYYRIDPTVLAFTPP